MKKKLIIIRFGASTPLAKEVPLINFITDGTMEATGCGFAFGVVSIVNTTLTPEQVTRAFDEVAAETSDVLPTLVFDPNGEIGFNLANEIFPNFANCDRDFDEAFGQSTSRCTLSLDELLDLVKEKGLANLTDVELTRLKELSK